LTQNPNYAQNLELSLLTGVECPTMAQRCPLLISFWIDGTDPNGPIGFGVTAWSIEDAFTLIKERGFRLDEGCAIVHQGVRPHEVTFAHVERNSGPASFRGIWYPCVNIGWEASGAR